MEREHFTGKRWRSSDADEMISRGYLEVLLDSMPVVSNLTPGYLVPARPRGCSGFHNTLLPLGISLCVSRIVGGNYNHTSQTLEPKQIILVVTSRKEKIYSSKLCFFSLEK